MNPRRLLLNTLALVFIASMLLAGYWSICFAWADYQFSRQTPESVATAARMIPNRASYWAGLSMALSDTNPGESLAALQRANALNPHESQYWIDLGLVKESRGDLKEAEKDLLKAAEVDRMYLPRWSLANFYFRQGNKDEFWRWAHKAMEMAYGDPSPLFNLCWEMTQDAQRIERELNIERPEIRIQYLSFLLGQNHPEAIAPAALRAASAATPEAGTILLAACERLLKDQRVDDAVRVWTLVQTPKPSTAFTITNSDFATPPISTGFDWRLVDFDGIAVSREELSPGLRLSFSGKQREDCEPLWQLAPVKAGTSYRLRIQFEAEGIPKGSGLQWRVHNAYGDALIAETDGQELQFTAPRDCRLIRLALRYRRAAGHRRIEGNVLLHRVTLTSVTPGD